jgi:hypothetical protein
MKKHLLTNFAATVLVFAIWPVAAQAATCPSAPPG